MTAMICERCDVLVGSGEYVTRCTPCEKIHEGIIAKVAYIKAANLIQEYSLWMLQRGRIGSEAQLEIVVLARKIREMGDGVSKETAASEGQTTDEASGRHHEDQPKDID
jgi:hypothetical protein